MNKIQKSEEFLNTKEYELDEKMRNQFEGTNYKLKLIDQEE